MAETKPSNHRPSNPPLEPMIEDRFSSRAFSVTAQRHNVRQIRGTTETLMGYLVITSLICAIAGAAMLSRYNKAGSGFLLGGLLGPIGLIIAWTMRDNAKLDESAMRASATSPTEVRDERECPFCAERILRKQRFVNTAVVT